MTNSFIENLSSEIKKGLPGEKSHIKMAPLNRPLTSFFVKEGIVVRESAVAIILFPKNGNIHSILIQRQEYDGNHSGQIAFPGGKKDSGDKHLEFTARRETWEEVGLPIENGELLGALTKVYIPVSGFIVQPYIYFHSEIIDFTPNEREVKEIITFELSELLKESSISSMDINLSSGFTQKNVPCFEISDKQVWGATALILNELRDLILNIK